MARPFNARVRAYLAGRRWVSRAEHAQYLLAFGVASGWVR